MRSCVPLISQQQQQQHVMMVKGDLAPCLRRSWEQQFISMGGADADAAANFANRCWISRFVPLLDTERVKTESMATEDNRLSADCQLVEQCMLEAGDEAGHGVVEIILAHLLEKWAVGVTGGELDDMERAIHKTGIS